MKHCLKLVLNTLALAFLLTVAATLAAAQDPSAASPPDNTKVNERDRDKAEPTADQQK
jgi:hypothetical protein